MAHGRARHARRPAGNAGKVDADRKMIDAQAAIADSVLPDSLGTCACA
jgi:hypothetical protein